MEDNNQNQEQEDKRRKSATDRASDVYRNIRNTQRNTRLIIQNVKRVVQAVRWFTNPYFIVFATIIILTIIFIMEFGPGNPLGGGGDSSEQSSTAPGGGTPSSVGSLNYYIPFRDSSIIPADLRSEIRANWPSARLENWDTIISQSIANGWNPAFILTLWVEESGAQGVTSYTDALGCDPSNPTTDINRSLSCVFNSFGALSNDRFEDFMCRYGGDNFSDGPCTFNVHNPNFPVNIRAWYEKFVPSGPGALVEVLPSTPPTLSGSCPIAGGTAANVTCGSFFTTRSGCGHCNPNAGYGPYMSYCNYEAINYAEDIGGVAGQAAYLPTINNELIVWTHERTSGGSSNLGYIRYYSGIAEGSGSRYWLQFHHVDRDIGALEGVSGDIGAQICTTSPDCNHVHVEFSTVTAGGGMIPQDAPLFLCI